MDASLSCADEAQTRPAGIPPVRSTAFLRRGCFYAGLVCLPRPGQICGDRMRRRFQIILVLVAWLLASGGQWQLIQSFAWGRMIATYAETMPLSEAIRLTFTPDNLCGICELVMAAQQQDTSDAPLPAGASLDAKNLFLTLPSPSFILDAPGTARWALHDLMTPDSARRAPPLPPPRGNAV